MTTSNPAISRVSLARQSYQSSVAQTYAALLQTLQYSAGFDVAGNDDAAHAVRFRLPDGDHMRGRHRRAHRRERQRRRL